MFRKIGAAIYRGLFWTYERGTWQYDIMVALILAFIFLTPRSWFGDQPAAPEASGVVLLSSNQQEKVYQVPAALLKTDLSAGTEALGGQLQQVIEAYVGKPVRLVHFKPEKDESGKVVSYAVRVHE
ncbi:MAG TPA: hypothetical protein VNN17_12540 [Terriglobia bacterium]|nr:hypothetical protein [Terriglobia bacterium]